MTIGNIVGTVVSTVKHPALKGQKLLLVRPVDLHCGRSGKAVLAIDTVQAGIGDTVLLLEEGNSARMILDQPMGPVRSVIVGIIDSVDIYE